MSKVKKINLPLNEDTIKDLKCGDMVSISGVIYTARDAAHQRLINSINKGENLPFDIKEQIIYYVGPTPNKPDEIIGSAGPTTSYRMDDLTIPLLKLGLKGMIGKGYRSDIVVEGLKEYNAVYFAAIGGAGAYISNSIKSSCVIAYEDLGAEAIRKLEVIDFPAIVAIDCKGNSIYKLGREKYKK